MRIVAITGNFIFGVSLQSLCNFEPILVDAVVGTRTRTHVYVSPFSGSQKQKVYIIYDQISNLEPSSLLAVLTHLGVAILAREENEEGSERV